LIDPSYFTPSSLHPDILFFSLFSPSHFRTFSLVHPTPSTYHVHPRESVCGLILTFDDSFRKPEYEDRRSGERSCARAGVVLFEGEESEKGSFVCLTFTSFFLAHRERYEYLLF
jgi:hypothetical protein